MPETLDPRIQNATIDMDGRLVLNVNDNILKWKLPARMGTTPKVDAQLANSYLHRFEDALRADKQNTEHGWVSGEHINTSLFTIQNIGDGKIRMGIEDPRMPQLEMPRSVWKRIERENPMSPRNCYLTALHEQQKISEAIHAYYPDDSRRPESVDVHTKGDKVMIFAPATEGQMRQVAHINKDVYDRLTDRNISPKDIYAMVFSVGLPHAGVSYRNANQDRSFIDGIKDFGHGIAHSASDLFDRLTSGNGQQTMNR